MKILRLIVLLFTIFFANYLNATQSNDELNENIRNFKYFDPNTVLENDSYENIFVKTFKPIAYYDIARFSLFKYEDYGAQYSYLGKNTDAKNSYFFSLQTNIDFDLMGIIFSDFYCSDKSRYAYTILWDQNEQLNNSDDLGLSLSYRYERDEFSSFGLDYTYQIANANENKTNISDIGFYSSLNIKDKIYLGLIYDIMKFGNNDIYTSQQINSSETNISFSFNYLFKSFNFMALITNGISHNNYKPSIDIYSHDLTSSLIENPRVFEFKYSPADDNLSYGLRRSSFKQLLTGESETLTSLFLEFKFIN